MKLYALRVKSSNSKYFKVGDFMSYDDEYGEWMSERNFDDESRVRATLFLATAPAQEVADTIAAREKAFNVAFEIVDIDDL